jgi:hypothetical protein
LLIASVSANVYTTMYMSAKVGVLSSKIQFVAGSDYSATGGSITNNAQQVTFSHMNGTIGGNTTYTDPVNVTNIDSSSHMIELQLSSWTGISSTPLYNITISMFDKTNALQGSSIVLVPNGIGQVISTGSVSIEGGATWRVQWSIFWTGSATSSNSVNVNLQLVVLS